MIILGKWSYNTYFKVETGVPGCLMIILGKWSYNAYFKVETGVPGSLMIILENDHISDFRLKQGYQGV